MNELNLEPKFEEFISMASDYDVVSIRAEFTSDTETPLSAYAKLSTRKPAFLFESVIGGEQVSRYSFVGFSPWKTISCDLTESTITDSNGHSTKKSTPSDPLKLIEEQIAGIRYHGMNDKRFSGGAVGFINYEYSSRIERTVPIAKKNELGIPVVFFMITDLVLIFDHACQTLTICSNARTEGDLGDSYSSARNKIIETLEILSKPSNLEPIPLPKESKLVMPEGNVTQEQFEKLVENAKELIRSGDVIQTVLSQRFSADFKFPPINLYRAIRVINPSPYMFLLENNDYAIVGASPEVHVRLIGDEVMIRPIAGTRPRGENQSEDQEMEKDLLADEKEKAEHLMLVDLARNDIGRVCRPGSVRAPEFMSIERYSHVMHIVSEVVGKLLPGHNAFDLMRATFPAGTVSGAPKVRAMQIIAELEELQRNSYAGALGYFGFEGNHDSCIAIRTAMIVDGKIHLQTGAGVVADSIPHKEYEETINKAMSMLKALAFAGKINHETLKSKA